jgi:hypothetical protein
VDLRNNGGCPRRRWSFNGSIHRGCRAYLAVEGFPEWNHSSAFWYARTKITARPWFRVNRNGTILWWGRGSGPCLQGSPAPVWSPLFPFQGRCDYHAICRWRKSGALQCDPVLGLIRGQVHENWRKAWPVSRSIQGKREKFLNGGAWYEAMFPARADFFKRSLKDMRAVTTGGMPSARPGR